MRIHTLLLGLMVALCAAGPTMAQNAPASWREPAATYKPVPPTRTMIDELRPGYQRQLIAIDGSTITEAQKKLARLNLRESYLARIRRDRRAQYDAHYVRKEIWRQCHGYGGSDRGQTCSSELCFLAPSADYYTVAAWAGYYRGRNISDNSIRHGKNGYYRSGRLVPIRNGGGKVCSVDVNGLRHGKVRILTRANFKYRPAYVDRMVIADADTILGAIGG